MTPPLGPIDGALALSVGARRAVQRRRRHLLPSAPLCGQVRRRAMARSSPGSTGHAFNWRALHEPRAGEAPTREIRTERTIEVVERGSARLVTPPPDAHPQPGSPPGVPAHATAVGPSAPRAAERRAPAHEPSDVSRPADAPRAVRAFAAVPVLAAAPALVWFSRNATGRLARVAENRRSAGVAAPDGVRQRLAAATRLVRARTVPASRVAAVSQLPLRGRAGDFNPRTAAHVERRESKSVGLVSSDDRLDPLPPRWAPLLAAFHEGAWDPGGRNESVLAAALTPEPAHLASVDLGSVTGPSRPVVTVVSETLERGIATRIREEVELAVKRTEPARPAPSGATLPQENSPLAPARIDDRLAGAMIDRIRGLLREEQFRHGLLG